MNASTLKDWLVPVSTSLVLISTAVGIWLSLRDYRLKLQAEARLKYSAQVETDIQLLKLFTEIMNIANARGASVVSEKAVEFLLKDKNLQELTMNGRHIRDILMDGAVLVLPVGEAAQDAAIAAIATLGRRHEILQDASVQALESLVSFKGDIARKYLAQFKRNSSGLLERQSGGA
jgi:hypothetical protein